MIVKLFSTYWIRISWCAVNNKCSRVFPISFPEPSLPLSSGAGNERLWDKAFRIAFSLAEYLIGVFPTNWIWNSLTAHARKLTTKPTDRPTDRPSQKPAIAITRPLRYAHSRVKKESIRQKLKLSPSSHLREKLINLSKTVKRMLWNSRDEFLGSVESDVNTNPKLFLSILKLDSKSHTIPARVSTPISASASTDPGNRTPLRSSAENSREIANPFNSYFA